MVLQFATSKSAGLWLSFTAFNLLLILNLIRWFSANAKLHIQCLFIELRLSCCECLCPRRGQMGPFDFDKRQGRASRHKLIIDLSSRTLPHRACSVNDQQAAPKVRSWLVECRGIMHVHLFPPLPNLHNTTETEWTDLLMFSSKQSWRRLGKLWYSKRQRCVWSKLNKCPYFD